MRIALVCGDLQPELDGVAAYTERLNAELRHRGVDCRILHSGDGAAAGRSIGSVWSAAAVVRARGSLRSADLVHVQFAPSLYRYRRAIGLLPLIGTRPVVTTLHEYGWWRWMPGPEWLWRRAEASVAADRETGLLVPRSRAVITTNAVHSAALEARFGHNVGSERIPIGANVEVAATLGRREARRSVRDELGASTGTTLVAFFGFVHPVKGVRYLIDAIAHVVSAGRDIHLLLVGGFESLALPADEAAAFEREVRELVDAAGLEDRVTITGYLEPEAVSRLLLASDAAVLPFTAGVTTKSGSLLTVLAHGLPTIVTDGADPEIVDGEQCIVIDAVRDSRAIEVALQHLLADEALARRIARGGALLARSRRWSVIADRHLAVYERILR